LELNGTGKLQDSNYNEQWLQDGDEVVLTIDGLGTLHNTIRKENSDFSILALKKQPLD
jgi:fumarylacetoacetate (FAA) hydrolase